MYFDPSVPVSDYKELHGGLK